ncbi:MAG TPA: CpsB/CapC family capsule biosynthesis tyrosine phosphatase [Thermodesulfobacteriota bacterium]|nr:CpsB/CapC family capsule biosynthesis tyrosine phosphatase [Thermodesulfobacteriota bacterium]
MIDLHAHILPQLDDGAETLAESVEMCRRSYQDGIRTVVATPHILEGVYPNHRPTILAKVQELNEAITKCGLRIADCGIKNLDSRMACHLNSELRTHHSELPFVVLPGADVHFSSDMLRLCENGGIVTVNDKGRYLMVEFDYQGIPYHAEDVLFEMITNGIIPIITHPERNFEIGQKPQRYGEMIRMGCLGQVTAMSLTGGFGSGAKQTAGKLLKNRLVHIIASDAHSNTRRPPILSPAVREAEKIVGREEAQKMVRDYPQAVIEGRRPDIPAPLSP